MLITWGEVLIGDKSAVPHSSHVFVQVGCYVYSLLLYYIVTNLISQ